MEILTWALPVDPLDLLELDDELPDFLTVTFAEPPVLLEPELFEDELDPDFFTVTLTLAFPEPDDPDELDELDGLLTGA